MLYSHGKKYCVNYNNNLYIEINFWWIPCSGVLPGRFFYCCLFLMLIDEKPTARTPKTQRLTPHEKAKKHVICSMLIQVDTNPHWIKVIEYLYAIAIPQQLGITLGWTYLNKKTPNMFVFN